MVQYNQHDIAVIGMAGRFPEANNLDEFWQNLRKGRESIRPLPQSRIAEMTEMLGESPATEFAASGYLDEISQFDPEYFNLSAEECRYMDPQQRILLELVEEALQNAGYSSEKMAGGSVGVFTAISKNTYSSSLDPAMPLVLVNSLEAALAGRVAYTFNFYGPALNIDTACSSSLVALHYACQALRNGECEYALVGGVSVNVFPPTQEFAAASPIWSPDYKVRAFDQKAEGSVNGEGGAVLLLKRVNEAIAAGDQICAVIKGSAVNSDGRRSNGLSAPNQYAQAEVIVRAIENAGIDAESISYLETHGTGTKLGDPIEAAGIRLAFEKLTGKKQFLPVGSLKTNIGHLNGAAGIASVVKVILAMQHGELPQSLNYEVPNEEIDFINSPMYVQSQLTPWQVEGRRRAGVSSFGLIGTNVHVILEQGLTRESGGEVVENIFTLSARTQKSLVSMVDNLLLHLQQVDNQSLNDIAYTLNTGRNHYPHRLAVTAQTRDELLAQLKGARERLRAKGEEVCKVKKTLAPVFIYTDLAAGDFGFTEKLLKLPLFAEHYTECLQEARQFAENLASDGQIKLEYFAYQYAYSQVLSACGIKAKAVLGIGLGKYVADVVKRKSALSEGVKKALTHQEPYQSVERVKLQGAFENMLKDGQNLFVILGSDAVFADQVGEILQGREGIISLNPANLLDYLANLYENGVNLDWMKIYHGCSLQKVSIPTYVFNRKSYLVKTKVASPMSTITVAAAEAKSASFEDVFIIFKDALPGDLELDADFEDCGGDSIAVMQIAEMLKKDYHVSMPLDLFYTVSPMQRLIAEVVDRVNANVQKIAAPVVTGSEKVVPTAEMAVGKLANDSRFAQPALKQKMPENILLTGVTGFLGAHLLNDLIKDTSAQIYCLVRGSSDKEAQERCKAMLHFYYGDTLNQYINDRVIIVPGDIVDAKLGLSTGNYAELADKIDTIIHSAADVRHVGNYATLEKANVLGTQYMLDFTNQGSKKVFHHISTLAVAGYNTTGTLSEDVLDIGQDFEANVYAESKYAAEKVVLAAREQGTVASIYRIGNLVGRYTDGVFQKNIDTNIFYNVVKGILMLQQISPFFAKENLELIPIDYCTEATVKLMLLEDFHGSTFHLTNPYGLTIKELCVLMNELGAAIEFVDDDTFYDHCYQEVQTHGFVKEISWIFNALKGKNDANYRERLPMKFDHTFSFKVLEKIGFTWPQVDAEFLQKIFAHTREVGYMSLK